MKKRVLLIDESLTVQKVVALTLDRNRYAVSYAKSRSEAMKEVLQNPPDLILASDQVSDINITSFPKEVESWVGRDRRVPPMILISGQDIKEMRHYKAVLRKPFSPQALQAVVVEHARSEETGTATQAAAHPEEEDTRLQKIFNDTFADEAKLTRETFETEAEDDERTLLTIPAPAGGRPGGAKSSPQPPARKPAPSAQESGDDIWGNNQSEEQEEGEAEMRTGNRPPPQESAADLWGAAPKGAGTQKASAHEPPPAPAPRAPAPPSDVMGTEDSVAYKQVLEKQVENQLRNHDLDAVVERLLNRLVPPIVERIVHERLDKLLKEQEQFVELKQ